MKTNTSDRRVLRTRAALQHALISLIMKKGYDAISVEDICEEANVGRSTFYLHYASKDALKRSGLEHLRKALVDRREEAVGNESAGADGQLRFGVALFEHARDHVDLYRALVGGGGEGIALSGVREILCDLVRSDLAATGHGNSSEAAPTEFVVQYLVGAYMAVLTWWLENEGKAAPAEIDAMFRRLAMKGIGTDRHRIATAKMQNEK
jgi:AcrR family transcriptional regulator